MGLKKLRVESFAGMKILLCSDTSLPTRMDEFVLFLCSKIKALDEAAKEFNLRFWYLDPNTKKPIILEDDDDLLIMWEGISNVVWVELEQPEPRPRGRPNPTDATRNHRRSLSVSVVPPTFPIPPSDDGLRSPDSEHHLEGRRRTSAELYSLPPPPGGNLLPGSNPTMRSINSSVSTATLGGTPYSADQSLGRQSQISRNSSVRTHSTSASTLTSSSGRSQREGRSGDSADHITVKAAWRELTFHMDWKSSRQSTCEELMGVLGRPAWSAQKSWRYKQVKVDEKELSITYAPRRNTLSNVLSSKSKYMFTIIFDSPSLFRVALIGYAATTEPLTNDNFLAEFARPLSMGRDGAYGPVATDWLCIQPPKAMLSEDPGAGGEYHCLYVAKDATCAMSEGCLERVKEWIKGAAVRGTWSLEAARRGGLPSRS